MVDLDSLRDMLGKAESKAKRLRSQADAAHKEAVEIETAIRVIERLNGAGAQSSQTPVGESSAMILQYLGHGPEEGKSPKEVREILSLMEGDISADLVRTQLWRMAKRGILQSNDGRYWRPKDDAPDAQTSGASNGRVAELDGPEKTEQHPFRKGENVGSSPTPPTLRREEPSTEWDLDDDVPF